MASEFGNRIRLVVGDITLLQVDAIVTAANEGLRGGGGVDGAVHAAAGPALLVACRALAPCPAGNARITPAYGLPVSHIIHAVGPIYRDGRSGESELLHATYTASLALAAENDVTHIAFPCISTGAYGFPHDEACRIATSAVVQWIRDQPLPEIVTFCCFGSDDESLYRNRLEELGISGSQGSGLDFEL